MKWLLGGGGLFLCIAGVATGSFAVIVGFILVVLATLLHLEESSFSPVKEDDE